MTDEHPLFKRNAWLYGGPRCAVCNVSRCINGAPVKGGIAQQGENRD